MFIICTGWELDTLLSIHWLLCPLKWFGIRSTSIPLMALACGTRAWKMTPGNYTSLWKIDGKDATWAQLRWTLMGLEVAGGVFSEWAQSAGWRVGLSVFVWQCSGDALFLKHQERQTYTQQEHKSRDWKFWACLQTLTSSLESKLKAPWAQPRNSWGGGVLSQTAQWRFAEVIPQLPPPPRTYDLQYFYPKLENK